MERGRRMRGPRPGAFWGSSLAAGRSRRRWSRNRQRCGATWRRRSFSTRISVLSGASLHEKIRRHRRRLILRKPPPLTRPRSSRRPCSHPPHSPPPHSLSPPPRSPYHHSTAQRPCSLRSPSQILSPPRPPPRRLPARFRHPRLNPSLPSLSPTLSPRPDRHRHLPSPRHLLSVVHTRPVREPMPRTPRARPCLTRRILQPQK